MTGVGSPLYAGLGIPGTPGVSAGSFLVAMGRAYGIDPAFILGIARAESSLGTNPNVRGGLYNIYGNSAHYNDRYTNYVSPTVDVFGLISGPIYSNLLNSAPTAANIYRRYEGENTWGIGFSNLANTMTALTGNLNDVRYSCDEERRRTLALNLGLL
jgi:hypothetical protein